MAYTGRKRVYAGPTMRPRKRTRFMKRRKFRSGKRNSYYNSNKGNVTQFGFRSRKMPYRRYLRTMYKNSEVSQHHRSALTRVVAIGTTAVNYNMNIQSLNMIGNNFWTTGTPGTDGGGQIALVPDTDVFIRGGMCTLNIKNDSDEVMNFKIWKITTTDNSDTPFGTSTTVDYAWDPTIFTDFQENFRLKGSFRFSLEPGDATTLMHRIKPIKYDISQFNAGRRRDYWVVGAHDFNNVSAKLCTVSVNHNLSFTTDRV